MKNSKVYAIYFLIIYFLLLHLEGNAQATFRMSYNVANFDIAGGMVETPMGDYVFAGTNSNFIPFFGNVIKVNGGGTIQWARSFTGGIASSFLDIKNVSAGGFIVTGTSSSGGAVLVRLDDNGNLIWARRYQCPDLPGKASSETGNAVIEAADGGFVVAGSVSFFWDGVSGTTIDTSSALGFKVDASGNLQWARVWAVNVPNPDEHFFNDVTETSDGFIFVGASSEGQGTLNDNGDYPRNALLVKTNKSGVTQFIHRWGSGNTTSEGLNSAITLSNGSVLLGGFDGIHSFLMRIAVTGSSYTHQWGRRINGGTFPPVTYIIQNIMENADGNYSFIGTRIAPLSFAFHSYFAKFNPVSNSFVFMRGYAPIGLSAILPEGGLAADQGYFMVMTDQQFTGFNYNIIRADDQGQLNNVATPCQPSSFTPSTQAYSPTMQAVPNSQFTNVTGSAFSPAITNLTPNRVVDCYTCAAPPAPTVSAAPNNVCPGTQVTLSASGSGSNVTYRVYTVASGGTSIGNAPLVVTPSTTTNYFIEASDNSDPDCVSTRAQVTVSVLSLPAAAGAISGQATVCPGSQNYSISAVTGATSYTWSVSGGGTISTGQGSTGITVNWTAPGNWAVSVFGVNTCGNGTASTLQVEVIGGPPAMPGVISGISPVCPGNQNYSINAVSGATGYNWSLSGGGTITSGQNSTNVSVNWSATPGVYTLSVVASNLCGNSNPSNIQVTVTGTPNPPGAINGENNPCPGQEVYNIQPVNDATGYTWTLSGGGTIVSGQNTTSATINWTSSGGPFTVSVTANNQCGSSLPASLTVNVPPGPPAAPNAVTGNINPCPGLENYSISSVNAATSYTWSVSSGGSIQSGQGTTAVEILWNQSGGPFTVSVIAENGCGVSPPANLAVTVQPGPPVSPASINGNQNVCRGQEVYSITNVADATGYTWTLNSGGSILTGQGTTTITVDWTSPASTHELNVTASNNCGSSLPAILNVTILPDTPAVPGAITGNISVCPGAENYSIANVPGTTSYNWSVSGGGAITNGQGTTSVSINWTTSGGPYTVSVSAVNDCGVSAPQTLEVTVNPRPTPASVTLSQDTICEGESVTITASGSTGGTVSYVFYNNLVGGNPIGNSPLTVTPAATTAYYLEVENEFGCRTAGRMPVDVFVLPAPSGVINAPDRSVCFGNAATLTASAGGMNVTITWWDNVQIGNLLGTGNSYTTPVLTDDATYYVHFQSASGCTSLNARATVNVTVLTIPVVQLMSDNENNEIILGQTIRFDALPDDYDGYEFFINEQSVQSGTQSFYITSNLRDLDTIRVIAIENGCLSNMDSIIVRVRQIANAFTPDGDGVNDIFLEGFDLIIMNRWGQELYRGTDGWDGTYKDKEVSPGTYYYIVTIPDIINRDNIMKGSLLLIRN